MKLTVGEKTYQVVIEVKSKEKTVLAGVGVVLGIIALIGFLASLGLHHTALTIAQDCARGALPGSVVSLFLAFVFFFLEKLEKDSLKKALKEKKGSLTKKLQEKKDSLKIKNGLKLTNVNYKGNEYSELKYCEKIEIEDIFFEVTLLDAKEGNKHIARLTKK